MLHRSDVGLNQTRAVRYFNSLSTHTVECPSFFITPLLLERAFVHSALPQRPKRGTCHGWLDMYGRLVHPLGVHCSSNHGSSYHMQENGGFSFYTSTSSSECSNSLSIGTEGVRMLLPLIILSGRTRKFRRHTGHSSCVWSQPKMQFRWYWWGQLLWDPQTVSDGAKASKQTAQCSFCSLRMLNMLLVYLVVFKIF